MYIKNLTVGYSRLVTGSNFSNKRYTCELTVDLRDGDHWETKRDELMKQCEQYVESKLADKELVVVDKDQAEKIRNIVQSVNSFNCNDLPF